MIRPILMASMIALAAPALAQNATVDDMTPPAPTEGMAAPNAEDRAAPAMAPAQTPTTPTAADTDANSSVATGTMTDTGTAMTTPGTGATTASTPAKSYSGVGGPAEPSRDYPRCSRTVTDNCIQIGRRGQPL